jgi:uracil-DNA glycosylase
VQADAAGQLRAWIEYYRDLGVYDFYRRVERSGTAEADLTAAPESEVQNSVVLATVEAAAPAVMEVPPAISAPETTHSPRSPQQAFPSALSPAEMATRLVSFDNLAPLPGAAVPVAERAAVLHAVRDEIGDCTRCPLAYAGRKKIVFADGSPAARLMFVGEGPGADEDTQGLPFVGKAGQLLNNMIVAMGLKREEVYIANIVKCRPPGNRVPEPIEANTCSQFLLKQIDIVQPQVIVALGSTAAIYLLGVKQSLSGLRGRWHSCRGAKLAVTYHPAFLLRDPRQKAEAWKDLQMVMSEMGLKSPARK